MGRRPLGRGLEALIGSQVHADDASEARAGELLRIHVDEIASSPFQPRRRFAEEELRELADSIRSQGVLEPLIVRRNDGGALPYQLIAGERRLRAARLAGLTEVPAVVREVDDRGALEVALVENLVREELTPVEEARALAMLVNEFGLGHEAVAEQIGKSRPYVSNMLRLLELPAPVLEMIESGELSAGQARPLLALQSDVEKVALARRIAAGKISARGAEELVRNRRASARREDRDSAALILDPNLEAALDSLRRRFKRKVRIIPRRGRAPGRVEIEFYDDRDLAVLIDMMAGRVD